MRDTSVFLIALLHFCFINITLTMLNFRIFQPLKNPLVATFNETRALTFRKYPVMSIPNLSKKLLVTLLRFCFSFEVFFTSERTFGYSDWNYEFTSRNYVVKKVLNVPKLSKKDCFHFWILASKIRILMFVYLQKNHWWLLSVKQVHSLPGKMYLSKV